MLSFTQHSDKESIPIAIGYPTKDCIGRPLFTVYFIKDYSTSTPPDIESSDTKALLASDQFRIMREFSLSKNEFIILAARVEKDQPVIENSSRTLKRAYLEIQRVLNEKLRTTLEFTSRDKVYLKAVYDTTADRKNQICTMFGSSGAGKSFAINDLCMRNPAVLNSTVPAIYLFSSVGEDDPSYKPIKNLYGERFIWQDPRDIEPDALLVRSYKEKSVLIFDDINSISDQRVRGKIIRFREHCLEVARHQSLVIISSEHLMFNRAATQKLRNSSAFFVLYPRNSPKPLDSVLDENFTMNRHERVDLIKKLKREGRAQFLRMDTPSYIVNTKRVQLL